MHPDRAVLIKDDYETYQQTRGDFTTVLNGDLLEKNFLFLGFSFSDPNVDQVLARVRCSLGDSPREHYWIVRRVPRPARMAGTARADYEYEERKQRLRIDDLKRYGIKPLLIDEYAEVTDILRTLWRLDRAQNVFVSGSVAEGGSFGQARLEGLARMIGSRLMLEGYRLISGFGLGIGGAVLIGALESLHEHDRDRLEDRAVLRPFPHGFIADDAERARVYRAYRQSMLSNAGFAIFLAGNVLDPATGDVGRSEGVLEEFEIALGVGAYPIPVGATGFVARELWERVLRDLDRRFPGVNVDEPYQVLGDATRTDQELVDAVFEIPPAGHRRDDGITTFGSR
jgi:hypothetical protein